MKRIIFAICTILCANVLMAQTIEMGNVTYQVKYGTTDQVNVVECDNVSLIVIPETITYGGTTYNVTAITGRNRFNYGQTYGGAFEKCNKLKNVTIPNSVTYIGARAFYDCDSLISITIPNSVTSIDRQAFGSCNNLVSAIIGNSVSVIQDSAFFNCYNLESLILGENVDSIGNNAFQNCDGLISVNIPNSVTSIGDYAFSHCEALVSISIGNNVASIGNYAFAYLDALTSVIIGESVNNIGYSAFTSSMFSLQNVTCLAINPPALANNAVFPYPNIATLNVPCGSLESYSSATSLWNAFFAGRISEDGYDIATSVNNDALGSVSIENYCSTATLTANANACYQFVGWNDGNTENPRIVYLTSDTTFTATFEEIVFDTTINATINAGETYAEFGFSESEAGTYVQNLQTEAGCDSTITLNLTVNSSLYDVAELAEITFYPNPTSGKVTFSKEIEKIEVIDNIGKVVMRFFDVEQINIETLPSGVYHLRLTIEDKTIMRKVIKE